MPLREREPQKPSRHAIIPGSKSMLRSAASQLSLGLSDAVLLWVFHSVFPEESVFLLCAGGVPGRVGSVGIQSTGIFSGFWCGDDNNRRGSIWIVRHNNRGLIRRNWLYRILRQNGRSRQNQSRERQSGYFFHHDLRAFILEVNRSR